MVPEYPFLWSLRLENLELLVRVLPFKLPDSVDNSNFSLLVFSPTEFHFSGTQVAPGQSGIKALAKALTCLCFFGIGFHIELVIFNVLCSCS
jgi:hypothetical protein